jgi:protein kinase A
VGAKDGLRSQEVAREDKGRRGTRGLGVRGVVSDMGAGLSAMWRGTDAGPTMNGGGVRSQQCAHSSTSSACTLSGEYRSLNAYKLLDVLGDGTIGVVRLVRHKRTGLHFALKAMAKDAVTSRGARMAALVEGERDALGELERSPHARIARMFAHFQDAASLYILLEYVPGGELRSKMQKHWRFSENVTRFYVASIATALDHLHTVVGVAHRDLKPENVLLDVAGYPKLVDLGSCARLRGERTGGGERVGRAYTILGTPEYLAPELVRGGDGDERVDTRGYDARAVDWWALGVLAFELTAGRPPFTAHNAHALYRSIAKNQPRYSSRFTDDLVSVLRDGFMRRDPSRRLGVGRSWSLSRLLGKGRRRAPSGMRAIRARSWFAGFDWEGLEKGRIRAPIRTALPNGDCDASNYVRDDSTPLSPPRDGGRYVAAPAPPSSPVFRSARGGHDRGDPTACVFEDW